MIVETSLDYLQRLASEVHGDTDLALEIGTAYMRVARVQGVPIAANLGLPDQAERSLRTAETMVASVLAAQPRNRTAFLRMAQISHDRMILASARRPNDDVVPLAQRAVQWLDKYLDTGPVDRSEGQQILLVSSNVANQLRIGERFDEALRLNRRAIDLAPTVYEDAYRGVLLNDRAMIHREQGELDEALNDIREAARLQEPDPGHMEQGRILNFVLTLSRQGAILGDDTGISLGRPQDALAPLERAFALSDAIVHKEPQIESNTRGRLSNAGIVLANTLRHLDAGQAVALYDHVLVHLGEVRDYPRFRRDEVRALAGSTYPLRQLGRSAEARQRLDQAFVRLKDLKLYPADQIELGSEAEDALTALGDDEVATGNLQHGTEIYRELLDRVIAAGPKPETSLADAQRLSRLYASTADLERRSGRTDAADTLDRRRVALWQHWQGKRPGNPFVLRQLAASSLH
jgi:tetratricopeptide (TPR) repeat protein